MMYVHDRQPRRRFLRTLGQCALTPLMTSLAVAQESTRKKNPICVFTKPFNSLSFDELADRIAELGFDGIEAPVRAGGHVEPREVEDRLPALVEALEKRGLEITVMASDVNDPDDPNTIRILRTAATLGIKRYRMKYLKYAPGRDIMDQLQQWRPQLKNLAAINHDFGIRGLYQNHAGRDYVGAAIWDLRILLDGIDREDIAVAYDIRHATVEGAMSWPVTYRMIRSQIDTVYVKDFTWEKEKRPINVPLGQGRIDPTFFQMLRQSGFSGPISLHEEYLDHRDPNLVPQHLTAIRNDLATLRKWLAESSGK